MSTTTEQRATLATSNVSHACQSFQSTLSLSNFEIQSTVVRRDPPPPECVQVAYCPFNPITLPKYSYSNPRDHQAAEHAMYLCAVMPASRIKSAVGMRLPSSLVKILAENRIPMLELATEAATCRDHRLEFKCDWNFGLLTIYRGSVCDEDG